MADYLGCVVCRHYNIKDSTCSAFPKGIPLSILSGEVQHTKRLRGQRGTFVYEQMPRAEVLKRIG